MALQQIRALADETRLRMLSVLSEYELSVNEVVRILGMGQSRVSRHLKIMAEAGLLKWRRDGLKIFYTAAREGANADLLAALRPFLPRTAQMEGDIAQAARILDERVTRTRQFFNAVAGQWDDLKREILGDFDLPARVVEAMPKNCRVAADLGCGTGSVLAAMLPRAQLSIGVDLSTAMLEHCRARLGGDDYDESRFSLRIGEIEHLPLKDKEANFACLNLVLHHLPRPQAAIAEIYRVLVAGGVLFVSDFLLHADEAMRSRCGDYWPGFEQRELEYLVEQAGFLVLASECASLESGHRLLLLRAGRKR